MFENPRRGRQARNFTKNVPKILDIKSSSEQIFSEIDVGCPCFIRIRVSHPAFYYNVHQVNFNSTRSLFFSSSCPMTDNFRFDRRELYTTPTMVISRTRHIILKHDGSGDLTDFKIPKESKLKSGSEETPEASVTLQAPNNSPSSTEHRDSNNDNNNNNNDNDNNNNNNNNNNNTAFI